MSDISNAEKLRVLLPHWIEHNAEHIVEFREWATRADEAGTDILTAAEHLEAASRALEGALEQLGGPLREHHHHE
jgi:predicted metallo-beta-lactamase superfamily hydrolase